MEPPELVVLIGLQASGKTTFYRERYQRTHVRISRDLLRTAHRVERFLALCLETRMDAVLDNTHPQRSDRAGPIAAARAAGFAVPGFYFRSVIAESLHRNQLRTGAERIPDVGILGTAAKLERPSLDEGFTSLSYVTVNAAADGGFLIQAWNDELR